MFFVRIFLIFPGAFVFMFFYLIGIIVEIGTGQAFNHNFNGKRATDKIEDVYYGLLNR